MSHTRVENIFLNTLRLIILAMGRSFCTFRPQGKMVMDADAELFKLFSCPEPNV